MRLYKSRIIYDPSSKSNDELGNGRDITYAIYISFELYKDPWDTVQKDQLFQTNCRAGLPIGKVN